ncbi:MAG TPA: CHAT domain-containing protein [Pyrinomonadaceae bacterium]|nr:CHAT domain-containing protein [Pyrinomonadaceae bacterium]
MTTTRDEQDPIRLYLLGKSEGRDQEEFERRLFADDEFLEEVLAAEDQLIDDFLTGDLTTDDAAMFEKNFLVTDERRRKLHLGKTLRTYARKASEGQPKTITSAARWNWKQWFSPLFLQRAAVAAVILIAAVSIWRIFFYQSDVDKGLLALNNAYREQRPLEARLSGQSYAPFPTVRGGVPDRVDTLELDHAERYLRDAIRDNANSRSYHALGKFYLLRRQFDQAIQQLEQALTTDPSDASIYSDLGAALLEKGKLSLDKGRADPASSESGKGMEELSRSVVNLNKASELDNTLLEPLFNRALAQQNLMLYQEAEQAWQEYLKRDSTSQWAEEARRNLKLLEERKARTSGTQEQLINDFLAAYRTQNDNTAWAALSLSRARTGNAIVQALIDDFLTLTAGGREAEANDKQQMLSYAGKLEDQMVQDRFTLDLATVYKSSTPALRETLTQARGLMKSAMTLYDGTEYKQAIDLFSRARELFAKTSDDAEKLFAEAWIGYCHLRLQHPDIGIKTFERLSTVFESKNYRSLFAQSLFAIAGALTVRDEYSQVLERARQSLVVSEQIQDRANAVRCLQAETTFQIVLGNYRESLSATFRALSLSETLPPDAKLTWPFYHEASISFYFLGMPTVALQFENEALRLAQTAGLTLQTSRSFDRLALIFERLGNYDEAMKKTEEALATGLKLSDERMKTNIMAHSALISGQLHREMGHQEQAYESYEKAIDLYKKLNLDIYQYRARKGKLLALIALNNDAAAEAELGEVLYWFEQNRKKIAEESYRNKFFDTDQHTYDVAVDFQYGRKKDITKAFDYAEAYRARSLWDLMNSGVQIAAGSNEPQLQLSPSVSPLRHDQIQPQLPLKTQLLEYAVLDDKVVIWVITRDLIKSEHVIIKHSELDKKINNYLHAITRASNNRDQIVAQAKELHHDLIGPIEKYLDRGKVLCVVPDKNLSFLPFAALVSPASGRHLIEDYAIQIAPSATIFIKTSQQAAQLRANKSEQALVVGNPYFDREQFGELPDLPQARREAEQVAQLYATKPLLGNEATSPDVKRLLNKADVVHLATHAVPDERSPLLSKLLLSKDRPGQGVAHHASKGFLQASEIYEMKFTRTRLVVLSACQTGIERAYRGEGAIGLARPFITGVPVVVASLWPVESDSTADLMISFHKHRKQDQVSTVEALRRAQLEKLSNQQPNLPQNYGWAAFVTIGGYAEF